MTAKEYAEYESTVATFFEREGVTNLSTVTDEDGNSEPWFSWGSCDCCRTRFGGNRYNANGFNPTTKEVQEYVVCEDCIYYAEYGQLDDMTMLDMDKERS